MPWTGFASALTGGLLTGAAGIGGSLLQGHQASVANREAYEYTKKLNEQADARAFNNSKALFEFQQSNAVPLQYNAMKRAGINPVLALGGISGGSVPSFGAHAGSVNARDTSAYQGIGRAVSDAVNQYISLQSMKSQAELNAANATKALQSAEDDKKLTDSKLLSDELDRVYKSDLPKKLKEEIALLQSNISLNNSQKQYYQSVISRNAAELNNIKSQIDFREWEKRYRESTKHSLGLPFGIYHYSFGDGDAPVYNAYDRASSGLFGSLWETVKDINDAVRSYDRARRMEYQKYHNDMVRKGYHYDESTGKYVK